MKPIKKRVTVKFETALDIEISQETDGAYRAKALGVPGAVAYSESREEAESAAKVLAMKSLINRIKVRE